MPENQENAGKKGEKGGLKSNPGNHLFRILQSAFVYLAL
jgi:hypothetical protein